MLSSVTGVEVASTLREGGAGGAMRKHARSGLGWLAMPHCPVVARLLKDTKHSHLGSQERSRRPRGWTVGGRRCWTSHVRRWTPEPLLQGCQRLGQPRRATTATLDLGDRQEGLTQGAGLKASDRLCPHGPGQKAQCLSWAGHQPRSRERTPARLPPLLLAGLPAC